MRWLGTRRAAVAALVLVALVAAWWQLSGRSLVALGSASMEPWASPGDLLLQRTVPAAELTIGDVVTVPTATGLVTGRVVELALQDGVPHAELRGDASDLPDPVPYALGEDVDVVTRVVADVGAPVARAAPLLSVGTLLLLLGWGALASPSPGRSPARAVDVSLPPAPVEPTGDVAVVRVAPSVTTPFDPRVDALLATCEQLLDDGLHPQVVADLARVRVCELLRLPSIERSGPARALDDGARFYVLALVDADPDALGLVPVRSLRRRAGSDAVDRWWTAVSGSVPAAATAHLAPVIAP